VKDKARFEPNAKVGGQSSLLVDTLAADAPEQPFPLERRYRRRVLPIIALFVVSLIVLTALAVRQTIREVHLEFAARRVTEITAEMSRKTPADWAAVLASTADTERRQQIAAMLMETAAERGLPRLKIYDPTRQALFSTDVTRYNEFYVPVVSGDGTLTLVFELYEPVGYLNAILARALVLPTVVPGLLLIGMVLTLSILIRRAQASIDLRSARVRELSDRLQSFMSSSAVGAVRAAPAGSDMPLKRIEVSLLYSDVRSFTEYAETTSPEEVVAFLNHIMTLQIECVAHYGGDVDKLIGDALLARFEGAEKENRAVSAALDIQAAVERGSLPQGLGIGVFTGSAILGPVGPQVRRDYTVIGDSVNIAARLCAEARLGEIICDAATLDRGEAIEKFGPISKVRLKGRKQLIDVRRMARVTPRRKVDS
jgi:adenylate cyclase